MRAALAFVGAVVLVAGLAVPAHGGVTTVIPPNQAPLGTSYPGWEGAYQVWMSEIPRGRNPLLHPESPRNCDEVDGVVFLGPSGAECDVPEGSPVAFSVAVGFWECSTAEGLGNTYKKLRRCAVGRFYRDINRDVYRQRVLIDGERLRKNRRWVFVTPGEIIDVPRRNIWHAEPGPSKSVTKGFFFMLEPLDPGMHTIRVRARDEVIGKFRYVWRLNVVA